MTTRTVVGPITHEAGNMGEWSGSSGVTASTTGAITGTYSARGGAGAAADGYAQKTYGEKLGGRCTLTILKCNYRPRSTPSGSDPRILVHDIIGVGPRYLLQRDDADGKLYLNSTANKWSTAPTNGTAYALEMWCFDDGAGGRGYSLLYVDGVLQITALVNDSVIPPADQAEALRVTGGKTTWDEVVDDVEVITVDSWN